MGLFDFFRKKEDNKQSNKKFTKEEVDNLLLIAMNQFADGSSTKKDVKQFIIDKGLDDSQVNIIVEQAYQLYQKYFGEAAKNDTATPQQTTEKITEAIAIHPEIELISEQSGSHGDNFGGLLGFQYLNSPEGNQFIQEMVAFSATQRPIAESGAIKVSETDFKAVNGNSDVIKLRTIQAGDRIVSAFPVLNTSYVLPFETRQIIEWSHANNLEAEIKGGGRDTFGLGFFATDYVKNKAVYHTSKKLHIHISAFGLVLDKNDFTEIGGNAVSPDFASYMPSSDIPRPTYYDFIGVLNHFKEIKLADENSGYLLNVKLINKEDDPDFFTVDLFINKENMRISELTKGMRVTGLLWLQGEIAN